MANPTAREAARLAIEQEGVDPSPPLPAWGLSDAQAAARKALTAVGQAAHEGTSYQADYLHNAVQGDGAMSHGEKYYTTPSSPSAANRVARGKFPPSVKAAEDAYSARILAALDARQHPGEAMRMPVQAFSKVHNTHVYTGAAYKTAMLLARQGEYGKARLVLNTLEDTINAGALRRKQTTTGRQWEEPIAGLKRYIDRQEREGNQPVGPKPDLGGEDG